MAQVPGGSIPRVVLRFGNKLALRPELGEAHAISFSWHFLPAVKAFRVGFLHVSVAPRKELKSRSSKPGSKVVIHQKNKRLG